MVTNLGNLQRSDKIGKSGRLSIAGTLYMHPNVTVGEKVVEIGYSKRRH